VPSTTDLNSVELVEAAGVAGLSTLAEAGWMMASDEEDSPKGEGE
jgi:hypothetical protein